METLRLSNSEASTWRRCPRKWYLGTYRRLVPRTDYFEGSAIWTGNKVHDALAAYYDPATRTNPVEFARASFDADVLANPEREQYIRKEGELVEIMLAGYLEWLEETGADQEIVIEGVESKVEVPFVGESEDGLPSVTLLSKLDAPVRMESTGAKLAFEHKTVGSLDAPRAGLQIDTQLLTEHLVRFLHLKEQGASNEEAYDACHGILYNMLRKVKRTPRSKPPYYGREQVTHNIHELRNHWKHVLNVARQIQVATRVLDEGADHHAVCPPNPIADRCKWDCQFRHVCPMADDGSDFEGALEAAFEEGDPLARYVGAGDLVESLS